MPLFDLRAGYDALHRELEGLPSRYAAPPTASSDDGIPGFLDRRASRRPQQANGVAEATFVDLVDKGAR